MQGQGRLQAGLEGHAAGQQGRGGASLVGAEAGHALYREDCGEFGPKGAGRAHADVADEARS